MKQWIVRAMLVVGDLAGGDVTAWGLADRHAATSRGSHRWRAGAALVWRQSER